MTAISASNTPAQTITLSAGGTLLALDAAKGERPHLLYAGPDLGECDAGTLAALQTRQSAPGSSTTYQRGSISNELGAGISGPAGLVVQREGRDWDTDLRCVSVVQHSASSADVHCEDSRTGAATTYSFVIEPASGVVTASTAIRNTGDTVLTADWVAAMMFPLDDRLQNIRAFAGRWGGEFQIEDIQPFRGSYLRENKTGRTGHDAFPGLYLGTAQTSEHSGLAAAFHLAWSGNSRTRIDRHSDGRCMVQLGEYLLPGEIRLQPGETYQTPQLVAGWSDEGYSGVTRSLHKYVNHAVLDDRIEKRARPVHFNTWEAVYFKLSQAELIGLAELAAEVGAERFVLDDGWFGGRRSDAAGLGDWWVSADVFPAGMARLASKVRELGMQFGIWFEPEMVNPDSDLFRAHPDWVLGNKGAQDTPFRNQLTLDLTSPAVSGYLFDKISAVVSEYPVDYIKWDMNRDTDKPASGGRAVMSAQTGAVYSLMDRLRTAHPALEIESCASGGGRADYGILRRAERIWTSDNNDARQRLDIQRGAGHFFPLKITGSHVGPRKCHITGRVFSMEFRAATAFFGHMGIEADLRHETRQDRAVLASAIALHKQHRELIHGGELFRIDGPAYLNQFAVISQDKTCALVSVSLVDIVPASLPPRVHFAGLDPDRTYRTSLIWPQINPSLTSPSVIDAARLMDGGIACRGAVLMEHGLQLPLMHPDTGLIFHCEAVGG